MGKACSSGHVEGRQEQQQQQQQQRRQEEEEEEQEQEQYEGVRLQSVWQCGTDISPSKPSAFSHELGNPYFMTSP